MNLEDELRAALRREDPSAGFAKRVVARAQSSRARNASIHYRTRRPIHRMILAAALAAMLVVGFTSTYEYREMKAERASRDAVIALRIASEKLNLARDRVLRWEN
jgi:hypothetical protein